MRSALDLFAYARDDDDALVIAAGIPAHWFDGDGVAVDGLRTPFGALGYAAKRSGNRLRLQHRGGRVATGWICAAVAVQGHTRAASINGRPAPWHDGELRISTHQAIVDIAMPRLTTGRIRGTSTPAGSHPAW